MVKVLLYRNSINKTGYQVNKKRDSKPNLF